ncbi:MAG: ATP-binding protein [Planctomycetota bacterium]
MSLRTKLALTLFVTVAAFLGVDHLVRRMSFQASFEDLGRQQAEADVGRVHAAIARVSYDLTVQARRENQERDSHALAIRSVPYNLRVLIDEIGRVHEHSATDPETGAVLKIREFPYERLSPGHPVSLTWLSEGPPSGIMSTAAGPMVLGSAETIVGDMPGLLVLGRLIDDDLLTRMQVEARAPFRVLSIDSTAAGAELEEILDSVTSSNRVHLVERDEGEAVAYTALTDIRDLPFALVQTPILESNLDLWSELERYELQTSLGVILLFPLVLLVLIQALVTGPLKRLAQHAVEIGRSDDASMRLGLTRPDEIGILGRSFDRMLEKLERSRVEQQRMARFAGRSEVAVGLMHNVGNLANSLGVSAGVVHGRFAALDTADLEAVYEQLTTRRGSLDEYLADDPRGKHLFRFFRAVIDEMNAEFEVARSEATTVREQVDRITETIQTLEGSTSDAEVTERIDLDREIDAALRLARSTCNIEAEITREGMEIEPFEMDRQRLVEILAAVLTNALEAMAEQPASSRRLAIRVDRVNAESVAVAIEDSGCGIDPDRLERIFAAGESTKAGGSGFGLHLSALAASELGGSLDVFSEGVGHGTTVTLALSTPLAERPADDERRAA